MRTFLRKLKEDVFRGENIDLYALILLAISLAFLALLGIDIGRYMNSLTLTVLALLAYSLLGIRAQLENAGTLKPPVEHVLRKDWADEEIKGRLQTCKSLLLIGPILLRATKNYYPLYEERLKQGAHISVLLVNPDHVAADIIGIRPQLDVDLERTKDEIRASLKSWNKLRESFPANVEIRVIDYPLGYGGFFFDIEGIEGSLHIRYYPFKVREDTRPRLVLHPRDGYWYNFYRQEVMNLWASGKSREHPADIGNRQ